MSRKGKILADSVKCFLQSVFFYKWNTYWSDNGLKTTDKCCEL